MTATPPPGQPATPAEALRMAADWFDLGRGESFHRGGYEERMLICSELRTRADELDAAPKLTTGGDWIEPVIRRYFDMKDSTQCGAAFALIGELKDAARATDPGSATYALPAEPDGPLWDTFGQRWSVDPDDLRPRLWWCDDNDKHPRYWRELLLRGPLSTVPPAGTEADHG